MEISKFYQRGYPRIQGKVIVNYNDDVIFEIILYALKLSYLTLFKMSSYMNTRCRIVREEIPMRNPFFMASILP